MAVAIAMSQKMAPALLVQFVLPKVLCRYGRSGDERIRDSAVGPSEKLRIAARISANGGWNGRVVIDAGCRIPDSAFRGSQK